MRSASPRSIQPATLAGQKSRSNILVQSSGPAGREPSSRDLAGSAAHLKARALAGDAVTVDRVDAQDFRAWFRVAFARYLQENFRNAEAVASSYGVRLQTALNWWHAENTASGEQVARTMLDPAARAWFEQEWRAAA